MHVLDFPVLRTSPRLLGSGWHFVPRLIGRVSDYPTTTRKVRADLSGERAAASREGAQVEVEAELTYTILPERVLDLHRSRGRRYEATWLADVLLRETATTLATASYDLVRNRDPELARAVRGVLAEQVSGATDCLLRPRRILLIAPASGR